MGVNLIKIIASTCVNVTMYPLVQLFYANKKKLSLLKNLPVLYGENTNSFF
jgi:hypothetical protein